MTRYLPPALAVALIVVSGVVHGTWTGRWSADRSVVVTDRLDRVALDLGDWQGHDLPPEARLKEDVDGVLYRAYVNRVTGKAVTVYLVCGRPGPVAVHTPDACYAASGFEVKGLGRQSVAGARLEAVQVLKRRVAEQIQQHIFWSWSAGGPWDVPDNPRWTFARAPLLYKLYLIRDLSRPGEGVDNDPCLDLMKSLCPELQRVLFSGT
jgi:hypothetical protein